MNLKRQFQSHPPIVQGKYLARNEAIKALTNGQRFIDNAEVRYAERNLVFHIGMGCFLSAMVVVLIVGIYLAWKI